jgi:CRISPR-associated protein Cmr1
MKFIKKQCNVRFLTPAFLGDAEQKGAWRTPPFKALIRQWYRVRTAKAFDYNYRPLHEWEGELFGQAQERKASKSRILLRLSSWKAGELSSWKEKESFVEHEEVERTKKKVNPYHYLGYGPLAFQGGLRIKNPPAITHGEANPLIMIYPVQISKEIEDIIQLIHWFGTVGARSRNGWGSFIFEVDGIKDFNEISLNNPLIKEIARPLSECLKIDWPHALGKDEKGLLIWRTKKNYSTWAEVLKELAQIKIYFRVKLKFVRNKGRMDERHILAYPLTNHPVAGWDNKVRLANQIRFKVAVSEKGYFGLIYHLPCCVAEEIKNKLSPDDKKWVLGKEFEVWKTVHSFLDSQSMLQRL